MAITDCGVFTAYAPETHPDNYPATALFWKNEQDEDFYAVRNALVELDGRWGARISAAAAYFALVETDGVIALVTDDPTRIGDPGGYRLIYGDDEMTPGMRFEDGQLLPALAEDPQPRAISAETLFGSSLTDAEYDALDASVAGAESARLTRMFRAAASFVPGTEIWDVLSRHLASTLGPERRDTLLDVTIK